MNFSDQLPNYHKTFFMLLGVDHRIRRTMGPPKKVFTSAPQAQKIARKLAAENPGVTYYVLASTTHYTACNVTEGVTVPNGSIYPPSVGEYDVPF